DTEFVISSPIHLKDMCRSSRNPSIVVPGRANSPSDIWAAGRGCGGESDTMSISADKRIPTQSRRRHQS
ncbi:hypothetical protein NPIL_434291, partial [Nephila pilipes]